MNESTKVLASEATLNTLQVTIRSLTVSGKQVTLAVFRQFPEDNLLNDDGTIRPDLTLWGHVLYGMESKEDYRKQDQWVVAEVNGHLVRCVYPKAGKFMDLLKAHDANIDRLNACKSQYDSHHHIQNGPHPYQRGLDEAIAVVERFKRDASKWETTLESIISLTDLPQLFIAV